MRRTYGGHRYPHEPCWLRFCPRDTTPERGGGSENRGLCCYIQRAIRMYMQPHKIVSAFFYSYFLSICLSILLFPLINTMQTIFNIFVLVCLVPCVIHFFNSVLATETSFARTNVIRRNNICSCVALKI